MLRGGRVCEGKCEAAVHALAPRCGLRMVAHFIIYHFALYTIKLRARNILEYALGFVL
jgi:predicted xylose isomerase-like sugar epimerase